MLDRRSDTIVAQATPSGRGGVGIIRLSGSQSVAIASRIVGQVGTPRYAAYREFKTTDGQIIDLGLVIYFKAPNSFTGEDVVELHGHGGPVVMDMLLESLVLLGARLAEPGEFSSRAFLNNKIDLAQAEAIADLIDSHSRQAASGAIRSLQGEFSKHVHTIVNQLINARMFIEAAIDFPEEEIDFLENSSITQDIEAIIESLKAVHKTAIQGALLRDGMTVVLAGKPNAGKSSLLNQLSGSEIAIVTDVPGTTRDVLRERILIDGIPVHVIDTAGLRESSDIVEQEGIKRAWQQIESADRILVITDHDLPSDFDLTACWPGFNPSFVSKKTITIVRNKIDMTELEPLTYVDGPYTIIQLSAKTGVGIDLLRAHLKQAVGADTTSEGVFIARRRHLDALDHACACLQEGLLHFQAFHAGELLAEDLRLAQNHLNSITGAFTSDDLLGKIFSSFCIGK